MPRTIEAKALVLDGDRVPTGEGELLEHAVFDACALELERRGEAREAGAENGDGHALFGGGVGHGRRDRTEGSGGL